MKKLDKNKAREIFSLYQQQKFFFPLIGAVLLDVQDGVAYADNPDDPREVYVEHAFGFSQIFGDVIPEFERKLEEYFFTEGCFPVEKIRLYAPVVPSFLNNDKFDHLKSYRQRFFPSDTPPDFPLLPDTHLSIVNAENVHLVQEYFGVVQRFWRSVDDFINESRAALVLVDGKPAALCYAAAVTGGKAEIDSLTLEPFRNRGLGKIAMRYFYDLCHKDSIVPLCDVFANNLPSMTMCIGMGGERPDPPYTFFTIPRKKHLEPII